MPKATIVVVDYHKGNLSSVARGLERVGGHAVVSDDPAVIRAADGIVLPGVGAFYDAIAFMRESGQDQAVIDAVAGGEGTPFLGICLGMQLLFERGTEGVSADEELEGAHGDSASLGRSASDLYPFGAGEAPGDVDGGMRAAASDASVSYSAGEAAASALEALVPGDVFEADGERWVRGLGVLPGSCTLLPSHRLKVPHVGWDQLHKTPAGAACPLLDGVAEGVNVYFTHSYALEDDAATSDVAARTFYARDFASVVWRGNAYGCQFHPEKSSAHGLDILRNFVRIVAEHAQVGEAKDEGVVADACAPSGNEASEEKGESSALDAHAEGGAAR